MAGFASGDDALQAVSSVRYMSLRADYSEGEVASLAESVLQGCMIDSRRSLAVESIDQSPSPPPTSPSSDADQLLRKLIHDLLINHPQLRSKAGQLTRLKKDLLAEERRRGRTTSEGDPSGVGDLFLKEVERLMAVE